MAGNHSRLEANKDNAITGERLDNLVEWYLAARLQNFENVIIDDTHKLDETLSLFSVRGKYYCMVHGDFDGSYGKVQSLQSMVGVPLYAVLSGHKHHNQTDEVQSENQKVYDKTGECIMTIQLNNNYLTRDDMGNWTSNQLTLTYWEKGMQSQRTQVLQKRTIAYWE